MKREDGPTSVEYAVVLMLVFGAVITTVQVFGQATSDNIQDSSDQLKEVLGP